MTQEELEAAGYRFPLVFDANRGYTCYVFDSKNRLVGAWTHLDGEVAVAYAVERALVKMVMNRLNAT